ncbi:MAG: hypothetical protein IPL55_07785 [Saprospiraceae bacterium]|nr:hypothetical protein [Saprospiraceae bacterium]
MTYYYFVRAASNSSGSNISASSTSNTGYRSSVPVVTTPTSVQASDGSYTDKVLVSWSGTSGNFFRVYRNTTNSSSTATALGSWQTSYVYDDFSATAGVTYYYFLRAASNSSGANISAFSTSNAGYRSSVPVVTTPTNVQASDGSYTDKVQVTWSGTSGNFFRVYRNTNSSSTATALGSWQTSYVYDDFSATAGVTYYYFLRAASNSSGANISAFSTSNAGYRSSVPVVTTPTNVQASDGSYTDKVLVSWSGTSGNFFRVYRNTTNSSSTATALGSWQTSYVYDDFSATAGVTYYYFLRAASNNSGANISAFSTSNSGYRSSVPVVSTPTNVQASDGSYTDRVLVSWSGTSGNYFRVYRNTTNSSSTATALGSWQTSYTYDDFSATAGVTYYYFLRAASNSSGANISAFSTSNAGYRSSVPVVTTPTNVQASDGSYTDRVLVSWAGTSGNYFRVIRNTSNSTSVGTVINNWQNTQLYFDDLSAVAGTTYYYFVQAASSSTGANPSSYSVINSGWRSVAPVVSVPASVNASDGSFTDRVQVTWSGTSGNLFRVYRNTTNSSSTASAFGKLADFIHL